MSRPPRTPRDKHAFEQRVPDPFQVKERQSFTSAVLATALFRCWHIILFFTLWAMAVSLIIRYVHNISFQSTLLGPIGTVLSFVISYRTTSSFERYNEGRKYWSQIILTTRNFARAVWFHIPELMPVTEADKDDSVETRKARVLIEKKTVLNLLEAFAVAVKHYLRGEDGIYYVDLYHLVKFLPSYALPAGIPSMADLPNSGADSTIEVIRASSSSAGAHDEKDPDLGTALTQRLSTTTAPNAPISPRKTTFADAPAVGHPRPSLAVPNGYRDDKISMMSSEENFLLPARMPPKYHLFDLFPFSLLVKYLTKRGKDVKGKKGARMRARLRSAGNHNLPLEITLYLSSYVAALQSRKATDPPTFTNLLNQVGMLTDALTGLERILTTPVPFSYSIHLWVVTIIYNLLLPFQIWSTMKWLTIPGTAIVSFVFFGFLVAGEEIENPFGYDKNDLNMDHFTHNIIRRELRAITTATAPDPAVWAFSPQNNLVMSAHRASDDERVSPDEWVARGLPRISEALATY